MICFKRPFTGLNPFEFKKILGLKTNKNFSIDEPITIKSLNEKKLIKKKLSKKYKTKVIVL